MLILGFVLAGIMGILLGMLGGGGSILTVPILVYVLSVSDDIAPSYSLFVVGVASAIGAVQYVRLKQFSWKVSLVYGIPSMIAVYFNQAFVRNWIPDAFNMFGTEVSRGTLLMVLFAIMMLLAAWSMIRKKSRQTPDNLDIGSEDFKYPKIALMGLLEGMLTGLVGAGGGFIIVPILVSMAKLPIKKAVGTSLLIMAVKSLIGFGGALGNIQIDWPLLLPFTGIAAVGIVVGARLSKHVPAAKLKLFFGWFILAMGTFIVVKTLLDA
ncbi:MAG: sulfite exporter TauE/SafE family protein [Bacteroidetes bacterium]|nr:sulfite exporter TauE/SafE family protein [Bacteroidota bacterium]